jgi:hypothetical protein
MRYLKRLAQSLGDDKDVATEIMLGWIALMLTALVVLSILYYAL